KSVAGQICQEIQKIQKIQKTELNFSRGLFSNYCAFNSKNEFILYGYVSKNGIVNEYDPKNYIWIYDSSQIKNNKWTCKNIYKVPRNFELINISNDDKIWLLSNNYIY